MNDAVDLLENYNTGGPTLAAQSDVIELIYLAAKARMSMPGRRCRRQTAQIRRKRNEAGSEALMNMLRQLLGMDSESQSMQQGGHSEGEGQGQGQGEGQERPGQQAGKRSRRKVGHGFLPGKRGFQPRHGGGKPLRPQIHRDVRR